MDCCFIVSENKKSACYYAGASNFSKPENLKIVSKCQTPAEALYYLANTIEYGWSRSVLTHQIESGLWQREGKVVSNFNTALPAVQSDLAQQALKDPYVFDFLTLTKRYSERELEQGLIEHITQFLLELGAGFAYMGKQVHVQVGQQDFYIDLLFYHSPRKASPNRAVI